MAFRPKGGEKHVITGSDDGTARVWLFDEESYSCEAILRTVNNEQLVQTGHTAGLTSVSFRPTTGGRAPSAHTDLILTSSQDQSVKIWQRDGVLKKTIPRELPTIEQEAKALRERRLNLVRGQDFDSQSLGWLRPDKKEIPHDDYINMAAWHIPEHGSGLESKERELRDFVLTASDDCTAVVWDAGTGKRHVTLRKGEVGKPGHTAGVAHACWSHRKDHIATCSYDNTAILWGAKDGNEVFKLAGKDGHKDSVWTVHWSRDDSRLLTASKDKTAKVWDFAAGRCERSLVGHSDMVMGAVWNEETGEMLTCSLDGTALLWDKRKEEPAGKFKGHTAGVWSAMFARTLGSTTVLTASHDMNALVYDKRLNMVKHALIGHSGLIWQASFSNDDQWVITASEDTTARVWHLIHGSAGETPPCHILASKAARHTAPVTCAAFR